MAWAYPTFPGDEGTISRLQAHRTGWLDHAALGFAKLGSVWVFLPATAVLIGGLLFTLRYAEVFVVVAGLAVLGIGAGVKLLVDRPRPEYQILGPVQTGPSFPSGHALLAVVFLGILIYLVERSAIPTALRRMIQVGLFLTVICVGASRVYMGVHWPSDVIGSYSFGVIALFAPNWLRNWLASVR